MHRACIVLVLLQVEQLMLGPLRGQLLPRHFDHGLMDYMSTLSIPMVMDVLEELATNDLSGVRNVSGYIMGMVKRYKAAARGGGGNR